MFHYWKYRVLSIAVRVLPSFILYWIADRLADGMFSFYRSKRNIVLKNVLVLLKSEKTTDSHALTVKKAYCLTRCIFRSFGSYLVEFFNYDAYDLEWVQKHVSLSGLEHLDKALQRNKGVIVATAHIGNWELAGAVTAMLGYPVSIVYLPHQNAKLDGLYRKQRQSKGQDTIPLNKSQHECLARLKHNRMLALVSDVNLSKKGKKVVFFDRVAEFPRGPAVLAARTGAEIVFGFLLRKSRGNFVLQYVPFMTDNVNTLDLTADNIMQQIAYTLEEIIRKNKEQWCLMWDIFE